MYKIKFILYCILNIWRISNFEDKSVNSIIYFLVKRVTVMIQPVITLLPDRFCSIHSNKWLK